MSSQANQSTVVAFPSSSIVGSLGELAKVLAEGTEVSEEFYYASALTCLGWLCGDSLKLNIGIEVEPRLFTILLGASYDARKSTAMKTTIKFFEKINENLGSVIPPKVSYGV